MNTTEKQTLEAINLGNRVEALCKTVNGLLEARRGAADRIGHYLTDSFTFEQGSTLGQQLVLNVPKGNDFDGVRLLLLPEVRLISLDPDTDGPSDLVYRPANWKGAGRGAASATIDAAVSMTYMTPDGKERRYSNAPFMASQMFSTPMNTNALGSVTGTQVNPWAAFSRNEYASGLVFEPYLPLKAGSSVTVQVTPVFSARLTSGRVYEYRVVGVLEGLKSVRSAR